LNLTDSPEENEPVNAADTEDTAAEEAIQTRPFARCATCRNAGSIDLEAGTLLCNRFNMFVNAEADEIPDDCPEYERDPTKPVPVDLTEETE